jgi:hypothetical protein
MTKQEAKELSLEVWRCLAEHPEIRRKGDLPDRILNKISGLPNAFPLCAVLRAECALCTLNSCMRASLPFCRWSNAMDNEVRQGAAREIVRLIEAWEPEEPPRAGTRHPGKAA